MFAYYCDYATELVDGFCYQLPDEVDQYVHPSLLYTARCSLKSYRQECNKSKEINQENGGPAFFFPEGQDYRNPRPSRNVLVYSHDADKLPPRGSEECGTSLYPGRYHCQEPKGAKKPLVLTQRFICHSRVTVIRDVVATRYARLSAPWCPGGQETPSQDRHLHYNATAGSVTPTRF
jgi:hypothetical protein